MNVEDLWEKLKSGDTFFIAEAGVNHLGDLNLAERLIKEAANSGAHCIKFQTYKAEKLCTPSAPRFWSPKDFNNFEEEKEDGNQIDSYSILDSFGEREHIELKHLCDKYNIEFMSTPFDEESADYLDNMGMPAFKIASCDLTNLPFLDHISRKKKIVMLSTGAANISEISEAIEVVSAHTNKIVIMHCNLCYPTKDEDANLGMISHLKEIYGNKYVIGLSDHTTNLLTSAFARLLGATVFERHYTVDKTLGKSPDNSFGVDPKELKVLINNTNKAVSMLGLSIKKPTFSEERARKYARRSVVAACSIKKGEKFTTTNLTCKRPGTGLAPKFIYDLFGTEATRDIPQDHILEFGDFEE